MDINSTIQSLYTRGQEILTSWGTASDIDLNVRETLGWFSKLKYLIDTLDDFSMNYSGVTYNMKLSYDIVCAALAYSGNHKALYARFESSFEYIKGMMPSD